MLIIMMRSAGPGDLWKGIKQKACIWMEGTHLPIQVEGRYACMMNTSYVKQEGLTLEICGLTPAYSKFDREGG